MGGRGYAMAMTGEKWSTYPSLGSTQLQGALRENGRTTSRGQDNGTMEGQEH